MIGFLKNSRLLIALCVTFALFCPGSQDDFGSMADDLIAANRLADDMVDPKIAWCAEGGDGAALVAQLRQAYRPEKASLFTLIMPDRSRISLVFAQLAAIITKMQADEAVSFDEVNGLAAAQIAFYAEIKAQIVAVGLGEDLFYGRDYVLGVSCGELEDPAVLYGGARPPMSRICPVYKAILYSELLADLVFWKLLHQHYADEGEGRPRAIELAKRSLTELVEFRQRYILEYTSDDRAKYDFICDLNEAFIKTFNELLRAE